VDDAALLSLLYEAADAVRAALAGFDDWAAAGTRPGQYGLDLVADEAARSVLAVPDMTVLSEESGVTGDGQGMWAVLDPVDGSTNASLGLPYYATSICVVDGLGPRVGVVVNLATGAHYEAVRNKGARRDGQAIGPRACRRLGDAVVGISGFPARHLGWAQFRALGAASLELCAVAEGLLDAYLQVGTARLSPWDYMAGMLICREAGAVVAELDGRELVVCDEVRRRPVAAATPELLSQLVAAARGSPRAGRGPVAG